MAMSLSRDNTGQAATGELINGLFLGVDNLLGLNDFSYLNIQKDNASGSTGKASKSVAWHWDMPLGYWSMGLDISYFDYLSTVQSNSQQFETAGTSLSQSLFLSRIIYRDQDSKLKLRTSLERKQNKNYIEDILLDSSRVLGIGNIGIEYEKYLPNKSQWQFGFNYYRGLSLFGAPKDEDRVAGNPKAQFDKFVAHIDYQKTGNLKISDKTQLALKFQSTLHAQHSSDRLFGSEQISIGSLYTVRGYKGSSLSASSGAYSRNSLTLEWQPQWGGNWLQSVNSFIAFDVGAIRDSEKLYSQDTFAHLMGWATGAQLSGEHYSINIVYARPHNSPRWLSAASEQWHFNLNVKY